MIEKNISVSNPDCVILQTGSSSIERPNDANPIEVEYFKQQTIVAANNVFTAALRVVNDSRKVILMKLPVRKKDSALKTTLSKLFNETISNLKKDASRCEQITILEDRYYKQEVTTDIANAVKSLFKGGDDVIKREQSGWKTLKSGSKVSERQSTRGFILPTKNRFEQLGN